MEDFDLDGPFFAISWANLKVKRSKKNDRNIYINYYNKLNWRKEYSWNSRIQSGLEVIQRCQTLHSYGPWSLKLSILVFNFVLCRYNNIIRWQLRGNILFLLFFERLHSITVHKTELWLYAYPLYWCGGIQINLADSYFNLLWKDIYTLITTT